MSAYGAVLSLKNTIDYILNSTHFTLVDNPSPTIIQQAYNELQPLQEILERLDDTSPSRSRKKVNALDGRIKEKIWEFEDKLESLLYQQILSQFQNIIPNKDALLFSIDLRCLHDDVALFIQALKDMERDYIYELENMAEDDEAISSIIGFCGTNSKMFGSDDFEDVQYSLQRYPGKYVYGLVGMAGLGKTTLAQEIFHDPQIMRQYECRAWVTVGRKPQLAQLSQGIQDQLCGNTLIEGDEKLGDYLNGKNCLIVLDDVWETQVLNSLISSSRGMGNGLIQFLVTARADKIIADAKEEFISQELSFLDEEESKNLLCHMVFGDAKLCPDQLEKASAKIAKKCEGLPLMIVTVADILSKSQNTEPEYWEDVAEERNSVFKDAYDEITEVLYPSYDYLPQYLKLPFLHLGTFPPGYSFPPSKLIDMLTVEGWFLDTNKTQSLQVSVWQCLKELCLSRQLVFNERRKISANPLPSDSLFKTCRIHSTWRYLCRGEARKNKFYNAIYKLVDGLEEGATGQRGLCLQNNMLFGIQEFCNSVRFNCASSTRSLLFFGPYHQYPTPIDVGFTLLRELDALQLRFYTFPTEILTLVQLKYLALTCNGEIPSTIFKLFNLRFFIVHPHMSIRCRGAPSYIPTRNFAPRKTRCCYNCSAN